MLAEIRAYGEGIVVAEQIPTKLVPDVVKNTALKVVHRLPAHDDRRLVGAAMNLDEDQSREVVSLQPGVAAVFADGMDRPLRVRVPFGRDRERVLPAAGAADRRAPVGRLRVRVPGRAAPARCTSCARRTCWPAASEWAWLRVWADTLVLAHVVNRPMPWVPDDARPRLGRSCPRGCASACSPRCWTARSWPAGRGAARGVRAGGAHRAAGGSRGPAAARRRGRARRSACRAPTWVIPQIRWLHEMDRLFPRGRGVPDKRDPVPPLDYELPGLKQPPYALFGHRVRALRRHPLSMALESNRPVVDAAILGDDGHAGFERDLAVVALGDDPGDRIGHVAEAMRSPWLEDVLDWPHRFGAAFDDPSGPLPFFEP